MAVPQAKMATAACEAIVKVTVYMSETIFAFELLLHWMNAHDEVTTSVIKATPGYAGKNRCHAQRGDPSRFIRGSSVAVAGRRVVCGKVGS